MTSTRAEGQVIWSTTGILRTNSVTCDIYHGGNPERMEKESEEPETSVNMARRDTRTTATVTRETMKIDADRMKQKSTRLDSRKAIDTTKQPENRRSEIGRLRRTATSMRERSKAAVRQARPHVTVICNIGDPILLTFYPFLTVKSLKTRTLTFYPF